MEFIDFQSDDFHRKMSAHLAEQINSKQVLSKDAYHGIKEIIKDYIGFRNIRIELVETGNLSVNVGYFSPKHILNSKGLDELLKSSETTLYKWFSKNKEKVFQGGVDFRTGRVTGSFQDLPITMQINVNLLSTFPSDKIEKYGVPLPEILSGAITHEMGHCYGGCALMATVASDNVIARAALNHYRGGSSREERVTVLKDTAQLLELPATKQQELQDVAQDGSDAAVLLFFNKLISQRNSTRALSLGVEEMSSEVIADVYAIRMGCGKAVVAAVGTLVDQGCIQTVLNAMLVGAVYTLISAMIFAGSLMTLALAGIPLGVLGAGGLLIFMFASTMSYFMPGFSGVYNADHRRFEDAVRQLIAKVKEVDMPVHEKAALITDIEKLLEINKTLKPWYEGTALKRMLGWLFKGSDFKRSEHEHFTQALVNNEMTIFAERLKTLA